MKKIYFAFSALVLSTLLNISILAQDQNQEKKVIISYTWTRIESHGSNQIAIWIEDTLQNHVCTLFATRFTTTGGYVKRPLALSEWTAKYDLKNAPKEEVDAITGSTPGSGRQIITWNLKDRSGKPVPDGTYIVRMEANILDADKMFFRGEIKVGGNVRQTAGEITFSRPDLISGNTLFKDVLIEYR